MTKAAPNDGTPLGHLSDAELVKEFARELARRRLGAGGLELDAIESFASDVQRSLGDETLGAVIAGLPPEDGSPKACPRCKQLVPVKVKNRVRHVLTVAGELRVSRNYYHCERCSAGFYPRDVELKLPEEGEVSDAMERRILDFGINDTFESVAERWSIHYPTRISSNLVRRVVERAGLRCEAAYSEEWQQQVCVAKPEEPAPMLVVATDGSMLHTREASWKEAKVGVVARGDKVAAATRKQGIEGARYVGVLGGQSEFKKSLAAALAVERADEVPCIVWLGDGARENWTLASELAPFAVQVLDVPHAVHWAMACGKALLGEGDAGLPLWEERIHALLDADSPAAAIRELLECLEWANTAEQLSALDDVIGYYRTNEKRMRYRSFRAMGLPVGSGLVESAHRHVLQVRMKRAGMRWGMAQARRMVRLRALYRTAGAQRFHRALSDALVGPPARSNHKPLPNGPRRATRNYTLGRGSSLNRAASK